MKNLRFRLIDFYRSTNVQGKYDFLMKSQWWSKDQILSYQLSALKKLTAYCYTNVPYYKNLFDKVGIVPQDIKSLDDLKHIPVLDKTIIKKNYEDLIAVNAKKHGLWQKSTGGSTGEPLKYFLSYDSLTYDVANRLRAWTQAGYKIGDKVIYFGGPSITGNLDFKRKIYFKLCNFLPISSFDINDSNLNDLVRKIKSSGAKIMFSYASSAFLLADHIIKNGIDITLNGVFTTAEMLFSEKREKMIKAFNCNVYNLYGANDGGVMAFECDNHDGLHIASERSIVEIINESDKIIENGREGNIVTTDLTNYSMPFLRYKINDLVSLSSKSCSCGRGLPLIKEIKGRTSDFVLDKFGNKVHGEFFSHIFGQYNSIDGFQVVQENINQLTILLKNKQEFNDEIESIRSFLSQKFPSTAINIQSVETIETTKSGKHKFIISKININ